MESTQIRSHLEKSLRRPVTDDLWDYLVDQGFVGEVEDDRTDVEELAYEARRIQRAGRERPPGERGGELGQPSEKGQEHAWALSVVVADSARSDEEVVAFRHQVMGDTLLEWSEVASWIKTQTETGAPLRLLTVRDTRTEYSGGRTIDLKQASVVNVEVPVLKYAEPGETWSKAVPTAEGPLERLRALSATLAKFYAWTEAQATVFVLTDITPLISPMRATSGGLLFHNGYSMDWAIRITLTIDPSTPPDEVAKAYAKVRRDAGQAGRRRLSAKHAALAAFRIEHEHLSWSKLLGAWNAEHSAWRYEHESNFRRDAIRAGARLLHPDRYHGQRPLRT